MSFLLERNEGRHQKTLQKVCNMPATQIRECEIRKKNLQTITSSHGFYLHGLNRQIPCPNKPWTPLCIDSCLYAYRVYMVCTLENKDSGSSRESIYGPHLLWRKYQDLDGHRDGIQKQTLQGSRQKIRY